MNRTKIEWTDYTWNPITGCLGGCGYCYARGMARRFGRTDEERAFRPTFHPERLGEPARLKTPSKIFVCSTSDFYGAGVPDEWREAVWLAMAKAPQHVYQVLTKRPECYNGAIDSALGVRGLWRGATATDQASWDWACGVLRTLAPWGPRWISAEPMLGEIEPRGWLPDWVVVGALTGRGPQRRLESGCRGTRLVAALQGLDVPVFAKGGVMGAREWPRWV